MMKWEYVLYVVIIAYVLIGTSLFSMMPQSSHMPYDDTKPIDYENCTNVPKNMSCRPSQITSRMFDFVWAVLVFAVLIICVLVIKVIFGSR